MRAPAPGSRIDGMTEIHRALRLPKALVGTYLAISVLTVIAAVVLRDNPALVTDAVWIRTIIVVLTGALMLSFAVGATRGSAKSYLRLRVSSAVMVVAIAVLVALPGFLPLWVRIEQGVCGLLLLGVVVLVNGQRVRGLFART